MPRPGYRWSRRRGALRFARLRKPATCSISRVQEECRLDSHGLETPGIRQELVSRVREQINAGTYDSPAKLEAALERMFDCLSDD